MHFIKNTHKKHTVYRVHLMLALFCTSLLAGSCDYGLQAIIMTPGLSQITIQKCETVAFEGFGIGGFPFESDDSESGDSYGYYWDGEDGNSIESRTEKRIDITFKKEGTFTVSFTVTDKRGAQDTVETTVIVTPNENNSDCDESDDTDDVSTTTLQATITEPTVSQNVETGETITFVGEGEGGDTPYEYYWYENNDLFATEKSTSRDFDTAGNFTIKFEVRDSQSVTDTDSITVTVTETESDE